MVNILWPQAQIQQIIVVVVIKACRDWLCIDRAMSYDVPLDPAAGIGITRPYFCMVSVMADIDVDGGRGRGRGPLGRRKGRGGLRLVETI